MSKAALPPCFVISLKGSPRRDTIGRALAELNIPFEFFDAVNGRALSPDEMAAAYNNGRASDRQLSPGEVGCALSHLALYRRMTERNIPSALIFEDDAIVGSSLAQFCQCLGDIPSFADVVSFYSEVGFVHREPSFAVGDAQCHQASGTVCNTAGYFIRQRAAEIFLAANTKVTKTADWPVGFHRLKFFVTLPYVVWHDHHAPSTLDADRKDSVTRGRPLLQNDKIPDDIRDRIMKKARRLHRWLLPSQFVDLRKVAERARTARKSTTEIASLELP